MVKKNFHNSDELSDFLQKRRIPRYALACWPEAPENAETLILSNHLRPLLKYLLQIPGQDLLLEPLPAVSGTSRIWRAVNVDEQFAIEGRTHAEAEENFWKEIEALLRCGGFECALYEKGRKGEPDLHYLLAEWQMTERLRAAGGSGRP